MLGQGAVGREGLIVGTAVVPGSVPVEGECVPDFEEVGMVVRVGANRLDEETVGGLAVHTLQSRQVE